METSLKTGFAQILSCCPKNVSCPKFGGALHCLAFAAVFGTNLARFVVQGKCSGLSALDEKT